MPTTVERPSGLIRLISLPGQAPSWSASFEPSAIRPLPGVIDFRSPATTFEVIVGLAHECRSMRMPRTSTPSTRPPDEAINGCSISGKAEVIPGVFLAAAAICCQLARLPVGPSDHGMAVQADDLVEQLGAKAVHHAHHDDQRGDAKRDRADAERRRRGR